QVADSRSGLDVADRFAKDCCAAVCRIDQTYEEVQGRGLARAVWTQKAEYLASIDLEREILERSHHALSEESGLVILCEFFDFYDCFLSLARGHLALLSRHFPATRRKAPRSSGSPMDPAASLNGSACFSGAMNWNCGGGSGIGATSAGFTTKSIEVTSGAPRRELSLKSSSPLTALSCVRHAASLTATINVFRSSLTGVVTRLM